MAQQPNPWRCKYCVRMNSPHSSYCGKCRVSWELCNDPTYVHKQQRAKSAAKKQGYMENWHATPWQDADQEWRQPKPKSPRKRTQSPRQRGNRDQGDQGFQKGKGKGGFTGPSPPSTQWLTPPISPFVQEPSTASIAPVAMQSLPASTSSPAMQPFGKPKNETGFNEAELNALRHLHAQMKTSSGEQTEDVKKAMAIVDACSRKADSKSYRQLVGMLDTARQKLSAIEEQWQEFRTQWTQYLDNATKMWSTHIDSYEEGENSFSQKRQEAAQHLQRIRTQLHEVHIRTMAQEGLTSGELQEGQTALDATMTIAEMDAVPDQEQFSQLKTELKGAVQRVRDTIEEKMNKRARQASGDNTDDKDVEVIEPMDKRARESTVP